MRKKNFILYIILLTIHFGYSQSQNYAGKPYSQPDLLIWNNDTIRIQSFPLYHLPEFNQNKLFKKKVESTDWGNLKNYTAEWKIIDNHLYLSNIFSVNYEKDNIKADLKELFPNKEKLILADWYSGHLFVPKGESIWLGASPGFPIHQSEWKMTISNGNIKKKKFKTANYYQSIYSQDKKKLKNFLEKNLDSKIKNELKNKRVLVNIKTGKSKTNFSVTVLKGNINRKTKNELIRVLKKLPDFDYYYRNGEDLNLAKIIPITYKY